MASFRVLSRSLQAARSSVRVPVPCRNFSVTGAVQIKVGDRIPSVSLVEDSPGNKVDLAEELKEGKGVIVGVPAAFSPSCSNSHVPGYISHPKLSSAGRVFVVSVNDPFVMKAWHTSLSSKSDSSAAQKIRFLADPSAAFTTAVDLELTGKEELFGNVRSKRYALTTEDGKVVGVFEEPDGTGVSVSAAGEVLG